MTDDGSCVCGFEVRNGDVDFDLTDDTLFGSHSGLETDPATGEAFWRCYRRTNGDDDRCLFHMDPDERRERWVDDEALSEVVLAVVNDELGTVLDQGDGDGLLRDEAPPGCRPLEIVTDDGVGAPEGNPDLLKKRRLQFVGGTFDELDLSFERLAPPNSYVIDFVGIDASVLQLSQATIENNLRLGRWGTIGQLRLTHAHNGTVIDARGVNVTGDVLIEHGDLGSLGFQHSDVGGSLVAPGLTTESKVDLEGMTVSGDVRIPEFTSDDDLNIDGASVGGDLDLRTADVGGLLQAEDVRVGGTVRGYALDVDSVARLQGAEIHGHVDLRYLTARSLVATGAALQGLDCSNCTVDEEVGAENARLREDFLLDGAEIGAFLTLDRAAIGGGLSLTGTTVVGKVSLTEAVVDESVRLDEATLSRKLSIGTGTFVGYDVSVSETTIEGDLSIRGAVVAGTVALDGTEVEDITFEDDVRFGRLEMCDATVDGTLRLGDCRNLPTGAGGVYVSNSSFWRVLVDSEDEGVPVLGGPLVLQDSVVEDHLAIPADPFVHPAVRAVSLAGSRIPDARLSLGDAGARRSVRASRADGVPPGFRATADDLVYDLSDATIGEFDTEGGGSPDRPSYYQFRFWTTEFDRFRFGEHRADFAATDWAIHELRPWGDQDVAAVTEPGRGVRSKPDTADDLAAALSPHFVGAHASAVEAVAELVDDDVDPSSRLLSELDSLSVTFPTPSAGDVGASTTRSWTTDAAADGTSYGRLERATLRGGERDTAGAAIATVRRVRSRLLSAVTDAYNARGLASVAGSLKLTSSVLDELTLRVVRGALEALATDATDRRLVADHIDGDGTALDDVVAAAVDRAVAEPMQSPLHGSPLVAAFEDEVDPFGERAGRAGEDQLSDTTVAELNERLADSGVRVTDADAFRRAMLAAGGDTDSEAGDAASADVRLAELHTAVIADAVRELARPLRRLRDVAAANEASRSAVDDDVTTVALVAALSSLAADCADVPADRSLASALRDWEFEPTARVRNDVWNAATVEAYEEAADDFDDDADLRDERLKQLEGTYTLAKKAAAEVGENTAASKLHYRQREYARKLHAHHGRRWAGVKAQFFRGLTGYGEKPQWVVACSAGVVFAWTGLFALAQATTDALPGAGPLELLSLSVGSFATLLPPSPASGPDGHGVVVRLLAETEALLGVFLVAVFVFTLTKSLQR